MDENLSEPEEKIGDGFINRVIARMKELGLSQADVARRGKFNNAFVSDMIRGRKLTLRAYNYTRLADALVMNEEYLRTGHGEVGPAAAEATLIMRQKNHAANPASTLSDEVLVRWLRHPIAFTTDDREAAFLSQSAELVYMTVPKFNRVLALLKEASARISMKAAIDDTREDEDAPSPGI